MDIENEQWFIDAQKKRIEKMASVKHGENVMHLTYIGMENDSEFLSDIEISLNSVGLELSSYDVNGDISANADIFNFDVYYVLSTLTLNSILTNSLSNATWDIIKSIIFNTWSSFKDKIILKGNLGNIKETNTKFGVVARIDKNTVIKFKFEGDVSEETILKSLDKVCDTIRFKDKNIVQKYPDLANFDSRLEKWELIDFEKFIRNSIKK